MKYLLVAIFVRLYQYKSHCSLPLFCIVIIACYAKAIAVISFLELRIQKFALRCNIMQHVNATDCNHGDVQGDANNVRNKPSIAGGLQLKWLQFLVRTTARGRQTSFQSSVVGPQVSIFVMSVPLSQQKAVGIKVIQNLFLFLQRTLSCVVNLKTNL